MEEKIIRVADYTEYPGPRYQYQGKYSGEDFYFRIIKPAFELAIGDNSRLLIDLDGTAGYASSFIDEAIGNLVYDFDFSEIETRLDIISIREPDWRDLIQKGILKEWREKKVKSSPRKPIELKQYDSALSPDERS